MLTVTRETKATLTTQAGGKVVGWTNDKESRKVSIAVPGDRAVLTSAEARALAAWLVDAAKEADALTATPRGAYRTAAMAGAVSTW